MKLLVDLNHPAHVHYFRNCIRILRDRGHQIVITARNRFPVLELLAAYGETGFDRGRGSEKMIGKLLYLPRADWRLWKIARRTRPDLFLSFGTPYPNQVAWLMRKPGLNFQDTENAGLMLALTRPFASVYCTPRCYRRDLGRKHVRFDGYMELSYLHPAYFTPDSSVLDELGLGREDRYVVLRFVSWQATHDLGHRGLSLANKREAVRRFSRHARVFISAEGELPEDLRPYRIPLPPERLHHALAFAALLYGESATMASECAVLGTPAIYLDDEGRGYTDEEEQRYGLVFNFTESPQDQESSLQRGETLLTTADPREQWQRRRQRLLAETIDVTAFMVWFVENFPRSLELQTPSGSNPAHV